MDDQQGPKGAAEKAFDALRNEVASLRHGIELIYRAMQRITSSAAGGPDYNLTLNEMTKVLQGMDERLNAIERSPALTLTPKSFGHEINTVVNRAMAVASRPEFDIATANVQKSAAVLDGMIGRVRERHEQRGWNQWFLFIGVLSGMLLWIALVQYLPFGAGDWLASLPFGGEPFRAGELLMHNAKPGDFDRMAQLYIACGDLETARCVKVLNAATTSADAPSASAPAFSRPKAIRGG